MLCGYDIEALLLDSMPPDEEMVELIEWAFLEGQIDGLRTDLAYRLTPICAKPDGPSKNFLWDILWDERKMADLNFI